MWLFLLFIAVPLIEIALFIEVGGLIGRWPTLLIVVLTAIAGTALVRSQGLKALSSLQSSFDRLQDPSEPLAHGAMILFSGALLLTPGFFTDFVGFCLLVPGVRHWLFTRIRSRVTAAQFEYGTTRGPAQTQSGSQTIDGEYRDVSDEQPKRPAGNRRPSGWTQD